MTRPTTPAHGWALIALVALITPAGRAALSAKEGE
jgi:hypothetical protein